ncbi:MAG TPA: molybdopterin cofactor-binding domain-containing protein [Chthonomonadaceae bacterium]|nr:molybdopterin cofactor-binding domain-containing protein [Chthonomonadaceae bacterium]
MSTRQLMDEVVEPERYELQAEPPYRFALNRRDLFRLLGAGILVFVALQEAGDAQESGRGQGRGGQNMPRDIGAWLHIGENGIVTAYTGKAEVGQNIRTSLTQAVAEELRLPAASVQMVMADTELTPYDMGTFGSRTTPTMAPQMHKAAAAARELMLDLAAKEWQVDRATLTVSDGKVFHAGSHREIGYAQLVKGQKLSETIEASVTTTPAAQWKVAGTSVPKMDGRDFVTGRHRYTSDVKRDGMLHGKILRPATYNATLKSVDTHAAEAIQGVTVVHDGNFVGVAATTPHDAASALAALKVEWQPAPLLSEQAFFDQMRSQPGLPGATPDHSPKAPHQIGATYTIAYIAHAPLEPRAAVAEWNGDKLTVWTGSQRPFGVRSELAAAFHIPESSVHVIVPDTGAGYGGKHTGEAAIEAARLAKAAGKPVKLVWTREEEFTWAYFRPAGVISVNAAAGDDGTITQWEFSNVNSGPSAIRSPYDIPNQKSDFRQAQAPLRQGSYRGLAATANHFAREVHMDDLAHSVKMDPLAFRLKNCKDERLKAVLEAVAKRFGWEGRKPAPGRGYGIAGGTEKGSYVANCVEVSVDKSTGKVAVTRIVTAFECGAVVNPTHLQNQVEGAVVMGMGGALFEAVHFDQERVLNPHFASYRVPRFGDCPEIDVLLLDRKDLPSAGAGETPIVTIAPAIGNAIFDATGIRLRTMPLVPTGLKV